MAEPYHYIIPSMEAEERENLVLHMSHQLKAISAVLRAQIVTERL